MGFLLTGTFGFCNTVPLKGKLGDFRAPLKRKPPDLGRLENMINPALRTRTELTA